MSSLTPTPGQTVGPFFHDALPYPKGDELVPAGRADAVRLYGTVTDGAGTPVPDALVEIWQADAAGRIPRAGGSLVRDGFTFTGFGRSATDASGVYSFSTVVPGATDEGKPAFFAVTVFARGLLNRLFTRAYVPDANGDVRDDALLASLPADERATLIAVREGSALRFDIRLQGEGETVFLSYPGGPAA